MGSNYAKVKGMLLTEYDEAATMELFKEEGIEIGRQQGIEIGIREGSEIGRQQGFKIGLKAGTIKALLNLIKKHKITVEEAAEEVGMTTEEFEKNAHKYQIVLSCAKRDRFLRMYRS